MMKAADINHHKRLMDNGRFWYCTNVTTRQRIISNFTFIGEMLTNAEKYYVAHTTQGKRDHDYRIYIEKMMNKKA